MQLMRTTRPGEPEFQTGGGFTIRVQKVMPLDFDSSGLATETEMATVTLPAGASAELIDIYDQKNANPCTGVDASFGVYTYSWPLDPSPKPRGVAFMRFCWVPAVVFKGYLLRIWQARVLPGCLCSAASAFGKDLSRPRKCQRSPSGMEVRVQG